jgi:hypothetical protein
MMKSLMHLLLNPLPSSFQKYGPEKPQFFARNLRIFPFRKTAHSAASRAAPNSSGNWRRALITG